MTFCSLQSDLGPVKVCRSVDVCGLGFNWTSRCHEGNDGRGASHCHGSPGPAGHGANELHSVWTPKAAAPQAERKP